MTLAKKIVFRLGNYGFSLPITNLLEIREGLGEWFDQSCADTATGLLGTLTFRGEQLPIRDLRAALDLPGISPNASLTILTIGHQGHHWGIIVDRIEGIFVAGEFVSRDLPELLIDPRNQLYRKLDIWRDEPLIQLDGEMLFRCWGAL